MHHAARSPLPSAFHLVTSALLPALVERPQPAAATLVISPRPQNDSRLLNLPCRQARKNLIVDFMPPLDER